MTVTLTEKAEIRLRAFLQGSATNTNKSIKGIRILVKDGGCNGYEYAMEIASKAQPNDLELEQNQVLIYVDAKSAPLLEGIIIDFVDGVVESGFKFTNPNATDKCSCGKSSGDCTPKGAPCT